MAKLARPVLLPELDTKDLSEQQKKIYQLAKEGKTQREIARELGTSYDNVRRQLGKIRNNVTKTGDRKPEGLSLTLEQSEGLSEILEELEGKTGEVAREYFSGGFSVKQIAQKHHISTSTVKTYLRRAKKRKPASLNGPVKTMKLEEIPTYPTAKTLPAPSSWLFKIFVAGEAEDNREAMMALATQGLGGMRAKKLLLTARARIIHQLAIAGRSQWADGPRILADDGQHPARLLYSDILRNYFRPIAPGRYTPKDNVSAFEFLGRAITERLKTLFPHMKIHLLDRGGVLPKFKIESAEPLQAIAFIRTSPVTKTDQIFKARPFPKESRPGREKREAEGILTAVNPNEGWVRIEDEQYNITSVAVGGIEVLDMGILRRGDKVEIRGTTVIVKRWNAQQGKVNSLVIDEKDIIYLIGGYFIQSDCLIEYNDKTYELRSIGQPQQQAK